MNPENFIQIDQKLWVMKFGIKPSC